MATRTAPVTVTAEKGKALTLGDLRQLVGWLEAESDQTIIRGTTYTEWAATPRLKSLVASVGEEQS